MISLADFQPLFIAKITEYFSSITEVLQTDKIIYHSVKVHASEVRCIKYDLLIQCMTASVSIDSQKHLH